MFRARSLQLSDKLLAYDEQAITLGHQRRDKHIFTYIFFMYTVITISYKIYYNNDIASQGIMKMLDIFGDLSFFITGAYCVLVTCIFLDLIRQRFHHLNEIIVPHISELPVTGSQNEITVYDVRYLHGMLLNGAVQINRLYGVGTLFIILSILLEFLSNIYSFIKDIQKGKDIQDNYVVALDLLFQTIYLFAMYHFTTYEVKIESFIIILFENIVRPY